MTLYYQRYTGLGIQCTTTLHYSLHMRHCCILREGSSQPAAHRAGHLQVHIPSRLSLTAICEQRCLSIHHHTDSQPIQSYHTALMNC